MLPPAMDRYRPARASFTDGALIVTFVDGDETAAGGRGRRSTVGRAAGV
jgi:hypothetical protein